MIASGRAGPAGDTICSKGEPRGQVARLLMGPSRRVSGFVPHHVCKIYQAPAVFSQGEKPGIEATFTSSV